MTTVVRTTVTTGRETGSTTGNTKGSTTGNASSSTTGSIIIGSMRLIAITVVTGAILSAMMTVIEGVYVLSTACK